MKTSRRQGEEEAWYERKGNIPLQYVHLHSSSVEVLTTISLHHVFCKVFAGLQGRLVLILIFCNWKRRDSGFSHGSLSLGYAPILNGLCKELCSPCLRSLRLTWRKWKVCEDDRGSGCTPSWWWRKSYQPGFTLEEMQRCTILTVFLQISSDCP